MFGTNINCGTLEQSDPFRADISTLAAPPPTTGNNIVHLILFLFLVCWLFCWPVSPPLQPYTFPVASYIKTLQCSNYHPVQDSVRLFYSGVSSYIDPKLLLTIKLDMFACNLVVLWLHLILWHRKYLIKYCWLDFFV